MGLTSSITVDRDDIWKGAAYIVYGNLASFPGELESVIDPTTYELTAGLTALVPTDEDGVAISRTTETEDGIAIDQKGYRLDDGEPGATTMTASMNLLDTTVDVLQVIWGTPAVQAVSGSLVNQDRLPLNAPTSWDEQQLYVIQEDGKTELLRVFAFRKAVPAPDTELNIQRVAAAVAAANFTLRPDTSVADHHGPYGFIFEEDEAS